MFQQPLPKEDHKYLRTFNIAAICAGVLTIFYIIAGWENFSPYPEDVQLAVIVGVSAILITFGGFYTIKTTDSFHHWDYGVRSGDKLIGFLIILVGFLITFWIVIFIAVFIEVAKSEFGGKK
jgi:hypothetical protein